MSLKFILPLDDFLLVFLLIHDVLGLLIELFLLLTLLLSDILVVGFRLAASLLLYGFIIIFLILSFCIVAFWLIFFVVVLAVVVHFRLCFWRFYVVRFPDENFGVNVLEPL